MNSKILYLTDENGRISAIQIPIELWEKIEPHAQSFLNSSEPESVGNDMEAFDQFLKYWDFSYQYSPALTCPKCQASTCDWRTDPNSQFVLANANFGGLLVFHCQSCGAVIKQMHFKDHVATEVQA